MFLIFNRFYIA